MSTKNGRLSSENIVKLGFMSDAQMLGVYEKYMGVKSVVLSDVELTSDVIDLVNEKLARTYRLIPFGYNKESKALKVAMVDPHDIVAIKDIKVNTGLNVEPYISVPRMIDEAISLHFADTNSQEMYQELDDEFNLSEDDKANEQALSEINNAPIVKLINKILGQAIRLGASDIHIEPFEEVVRIRYRIDGALNEYFSTSVKAHSAILTSIKIMSNLNIAEHRVPQDGRVELEMDRIKVDLRVSILPNIYGEKIVIRLLNRSKKALTKKELGFSNSDLDKFEKMITKPHGIVLVTGPTGSGKTTTLYAALTELNDIKKNIITVEDPVEYRMEGVNQTQVNNKAGLTFAAGLRSILRQDPDIIMIGEIRDAETASIAVRAAITGHLVFSTVHTNNTSSTISRLIDMGIEPYLLSSALVGVHSQRLIKRLCSHCKEEYECDEIEAKVLGVEEGTKLFRAVGCNKCGTIGYKGRQAIHELLPITRDVKVLINRNATAEDIHDKAVEEGLQTMRQSAIDVVVRGESSMEELYRLTSSEDD
jgi:type IV pilus assembly protein PilB